MTRTPARQELLRVLRRGQGLVLRARLRLRLRRADRDGSKRPLDRHARHAAGDRGPERVQEHVPRAVAGEQVDRRGQPVPDVAVLAGHAASFVGPGWQFGYALDPKAGNPKLKPSWAPSRCRATPKGKTMPAFLGGSDLAIPAASENKDLAVDWIAAFTATAADEGHRQVGEPPQHDLAPQPRQGHAGLARSPVGEGRPGSSRPRRTGRTSRARTCSARCSRTSSPNKQTVQRRRQVGEQQDHRHPQRRNLSEPGTRDACRAIPFPSCESMPPDQPSGRRRHRRLTRRGVVQAAVPYALIAPALIVIVAILGYPLYFLAKLSFQRYGLDRADRPQGHVDRARQLHADPRRPPVLGRRPPHGRSSPP